MTSIQPPHPQKLPQIPDLPGYDLRDIQLEMSLKPFYDDSPETRRQVCTEIFHQWHALTRHAQSISILLWVADGSEILEYDGDLSRAFEWARYQGSANGHEWKMSRKSATNNPDHESVGIHAWDNDYDPEGKGLHRRPYLYRDEPAVFTFTWLKGLIADLKSIGHQITGKTIYVGETFDIGPEFAVSRFKYTWHPEILAGGNSLFKGQFISCEAILNGDERHYAAYPRGIPDQTRFGTFLGKQLNCFFQDLGFDFLWLSNGFGFALEPWGLPGNLFDGLHFYPDLAQPTQQRIRQFWQDLRSEFPASYPIRSRGTNLATGIDLGSDASPLRSIYSPELGVDAPVNSPWASLDGDFGLELSGWMSHIARHPGETFRFRYYIHDPWWKNSPYLDRYERNPHDIFLPSSISRIEADGTTEIARDIAFLSIDDSDGQMPLSVPNEVTAHILRTREFAPDDAGPLVWLYPFDDYHDLVEQARRPELPFHADTYIGTVINDSVPLNTVMDLKDLESALKARPELPQGRIFLSSVPQPGSPSESLLLNLVERGGTLLLYGPIEPESRFLDLLGLERAEPLEGDFELSFLRIPQGEQMEDVGTSLRHTNFLSGGGFAETPASQIRPEVKHLITATQKDHTRVMAATMYTTDRGNIAWVRGSLSTDEYEPDNPQPIRGPILKPLNSNTFFPYGRVVRFCLDSLGWTISCANRASSPRTPYLTIHRHRNAFQYSGYHPDENAVLQLRHPLGAPLFTFRNLPVRSGMTQLTGSRAWSHEVRVFLEQGDDGTYRSRFQCPIGYGVHRRLIISGCQNATLVFMVDTGTSKPIRILRNPEFPYLVGEFIEPIIEETPFGPAIRVRNVSGSVLFEF